MAKNNQTFNASLRLNSKDFKRGVAEVQKSLASLKSSFLSVAAALGAGLGLTQLLSNIKNTAVQLSVAKNTLENVSNVTKEWSNGVDKGTVTIKNYNENLAFARKLADEYSQDLVAIMHNFAQFHAACEKTNLDLENQKLVFESLTKAAAYYHMSSDRTKDMMNAVTQMMSKGKVAAEELRRQLGNALPGAFNLMAAALGVSNAQLDDMMRKGQVLAADALPKFAAMLNTITEGANFDSLQLSMNRLKNTWYDLVENIGAEDMFNGLVKGADKFLRKITDNIEFIKSQVKGVVTAVLSYKLFTTLQKRGEEYFAKMSREINLYQSELQRLETRMTMADDKNGTQRFNKVGEWFTPGKDASGDDFKSIVKYNNALIKTEELKRKIGGIRMLSDEDLANLKMFNNQLAGVPPRAKAIGATITNGIKNIWLGIKSIGAQVIGIIKSMGIMAIVSAIIGAITTYVSYLKEMREEWERINNIVEEHNTAVEKIDTHVESQVKTANSYLRVLSDTNRAERERLNALAQLNKLMGTNFSPEALDKTTQAYKDIVEQVGKWAKGLKLAAKMQVLATRGAEADARIQELQVGLIRKRADYDSKTNVVGADENGNPVRKPKTWFNGAVRLEEQIKQDEEEIKQLQKVVSSVDEQLDELGVKLSDVIDTGSNNNNNNGDKESEISKVFQKFTKDKAELTNQLREHAITQDEFNTELDKLVTKYWEAAAATGQMSIDKILAKMDKGQTLTAMEEWYRTLRDAAEAAAERVLLEGAADAISKELESAIDRETKELEKKMDDLAEKAEKVAVANYESTLTKKPQRGKRDNLFDYKKTGSEIFGGEADVANDYVKLLEDAIQDIESKYDNIADASENVRKKLYSWKSELEIAKKEASSLEEAMRIRQVQEDIDNLNNEITKAAVGGFKDLAQSTDRIVKGMETLRDAFDSSSDATGWERFMAVFNEVVQIVEMFSSIKETLNVITKASTQLEGAELAMQQQKITLLEREIALREAIRLQKAQENKETEEAIAANITEAAASKTAASAKAGEAIAGATASGAKLAFPYNLIAIAAGVAAVIAALASMSKFAKGGIVGGNSYSGDRQVARVNAGEMILNRHQQSTLFNAINSGKLGGGNVQFKIRGTDLIGVINNEQSKRRG